MSEIPLDLFIPLPAAVFRKQAPPSVLRYRGREGLRFFLFFSTLVASNLNCKPQHPLGTSFFGGTERRKCRVTFFLAMLQFLILTAELFRLFLFWEVISNKLLRSSPLPPPFEINSAAPPQHYVQRCSSGQGQGIKKRRL